MNRESNPSSGTMRAGILHGPKDLRYGQAAIPEAAPGMVLLRVRRVGICGSDIHYFEHGCCGAFVPTRPFIMGHELTAAVVAANGEAGEALVGSRVTVNPARACGFCDYCKAGRGNLCRKTIMLGSASTTPPTDGAFAEYVTVRADQCHVLPPGMSDGLGAMMEPLAVALHAVKQAGTVSGKRVLVVGGGPIGLLLAMTCRAFGAAPVAVSDIVAARRQTALELGADVALDPTAKDLPEQVGQLAGEGFEVVFEASGAPQALRRAFDLVRPGGILVQVGTLGTEDVPLPANQLMIREIRFVGSFRYGNVFDEAIRLVAAGRLNLQPLISRVFPLAEALPAMSLAADKALALKVQIQIGN